MIHFDWSREAKASGKAPDCEGLCTEDIGKVTCDACIARIVKVTGDWSREFSSTTREVFARRMEDDEGK